jgi:two-component system nitrogen regulation response regulator GlnG
MRTRQRPLEILDEVVAQRGRTHRRLAARLRQWAPAASVNHVSRKPLSVLPADDDENLRILIIAWLEADRHTVVNLPNVKSAKDLFGTRKFDLIVTDILMPDGDGLDFISMAKAAQPAARIVAISGRGKFMESENCVRLARGWGAHAAVIKPFNRDQLLAAVDFALAPPASGS